MKKRYWGLLGLIVVIIFIGGNLFGADGDVIVNGKVDIGTTNNYINSPATDSLGFTTGNSERVRIDSSGNVGIGTTNPGATLEVKGTMKVFGTWESKSVNTVYQAPSDGIVIANGNSTAGGTLQGLTDSSNPPTTIRARQSIGSAWMTITFPVKKGDYWKVEYSQAMLNLWWIPLGGQ